MLMFADDAKLYRHILHNCDSELLNQSYNSVIKWADTWLIKLNQSKCKVLTRVRNSIYLETYCYKKSDGCDAELQHKASIKDIGVLIHQQLSFDNHITERTNIAYRMLGIINRNFYDLDN